VVPLIGTAGTIISAWLMRPRSEAAARRPARAQYRGTSASAILGVLSLLAWLLPLVGLPLALVGVGMGVSHIANNQSVRWARVGVVLNLVGLMLATANAAIGAYLGSTGAF